MRTAVITGVTGQDGRFLSELLLSKGYRVVGLVSHDRMGRDAEWNRNSSAVELVAVDFNDSGQLSRAITDAQPQEFYNLVAASSVKYSFDYPFETAQITAMAPVRILEVLRHIDTMKNIRFYQASSSEMYGNGLASRKNEESEFRPTSPYAVSKLFAHQTCQMYKNAYGMFISCGILFNHESSFRSEKFVSRKISSEVARIATGKKKKMTLGALTPRRDWGFAGDYVEAMWLMLQHEKPENYVIASGQSHSVLDFATTALRIAGLTEDPMSYIENDPSLVRPLEIRASWGDATKAKEELGWQPKVSFEKLVEMMVTNDINMESKVANSQLSPSGCENGELPQNWQEDSERQ
jgi:GDPmannose 4,6-dehydratase